MDQIAVLAVAAALFVGIVALRATTDKWQVQLSDIAIALAPILVWLVLSGKISELKFGSDGFFATFQGLVAKPIIASVTPLPVKELVADEKRADSELPEFIAKQVEEIFFVLGRQYVPSVTEHYLNELTQHAFFRFVVMQLTDGSFFGMMDARQLAERLRQANQWDDFVAAVRNADQTYLSGLPGFIGADAAVSQKASKIEVLKAMKARRVDWLPVTGADGRLVGVVERSALLADLIVDLNDRLECAGKASCAEAAASPP